MSDVIPVAFATDKNYVPLLMVAIKSLIDTASPFVKYQIYVLHTALSQEEAYLLGNLSTENVGISCLCISEKLEEIEASEIFFHKGVWSVEMFYRLLLPDLLPQYEKIVYLDCDVIVKRDIKQLYDHDVSKVLLAAVWQYYYGGTRLPQFRNQKTPYFNSGVMLINGKTWREDGCLQQALTLLKTMDQQLLQCPDQDVLNLLAMDRVLWLSPLWNCLNAFLEQNLEFQPAVDALGAHTPDSFYIMHYSLKAHNQLQSCFAFDFWNTAQSVTLPSGENLRNYFYKENFHKVQQEKVVYQQKREEQWEKMMEYFHSGEEKSLCFFGVGVVCDEMLQFFLEKKAGTPLAICDNDTEKQGDSLDGIPIISFEEAIERFENLHILITNKNFYQEIREQLLEKLEEKQILEFSM